MFSVFENFSLFFAFDKLTMQYFVKIAKMIIGSSLNPEIVTTPHYRSSMLAQRAKKASAKGQSLHLELTFRVSQGGCWECKSWVCPLSQHQWEWLPLVCSLIWDPHWGGGPFESQENMSLELSISVGHHVCIISSVVCSTACGKLCCTVYDAVCSTIYSAVCNAAEF